MKKIILFGAGKNGREAIDFFGKDSVECFVDNDKSKIGTIYCDKKIISINELKEIWKDYKIIVTPYPSRDIIEQLFHTGIKEVWTYKQGLIKKFTDYVRNVDWKKYKKICWYLSDEYGEPFFRLIPEDIQDKIEMVNKEQLEAKYLELNGEFEKYYDAVVNTSPEFYIADECFLNRIVKGIDKYNPFKQISVYPEELLINDKYADGDESFTEEEVNKKNENNYEKFEIIKKYVDEAKEEVPLFSLIEVETINRCNGVCEFCPVNAKDDPREKHIMSEELFYDIVRQLEEIDYSGRISLFSNNEPFLDNRIIEFSKYLREHLKMARIYLYTNGTLLNMQKFTEIISYLDELIIDNYTQDLHLIKPVEEIKQYCEQHPELVKKVSIALRKPKEIMTSRGGSAPNRHEQVSYPTMTCATPFQQLVIRPTGQVSLCCNDPLGKHTLGDLTKESILDVWYGEKYKMVRKAIVDGRKNIDICQYCDAFNLF